MTPPPNAPRVAAIEVLRLVFGLEQAACYLEHSVDCSCVVYSTGDGSDVCTCGMPEARRAIGDAIRFLRSERAPTAPTAAQVDRAAREGMTDRLAAALADCVVKAVERGTQDGDFVLSYVLPTGPIHRAIPLLQELGITVRPGFDGRQLVAHCRCGACDDCVARCLAALATPVAAGGEEGE